MFDKDKKENDRKRKFAEVLHLDNKSNEEFTKLGSNLKKTFRDQRSRFDGILKSYETLEEDGRALQDEKKEVQTTVKTEIKWFEEYFSRAVDNSICRELTNQKAEAEVTVLGVSLGILSATSLLNLTNKLKQLRNFVEDIPTTDESVLWETSDEERGIKKLIEPTWKYSTAKVQESKVLHEGDKNHKAQVQLINVDKEIGKWTTQKFSGTISVDVKSKMLSKINRALDDVVTCREQANDCNAVKDPKIGSPLYKAIFGDIIE